MPTYREFGFLCLMEYIRAADAGELTPDDEEAVRRFRRAMEELDADLDVDG